jgi:hypothetical protein
MNGWAGRGAQAVEKLPSKHKAKFKPNTTKKKKKSEGPSETKNRYIKVTLRIGYT